MSINVINEYIHFSKKCINKYIKKIMDRKYDSDIFEELINTYIDARYHDLYPHQYKQYTTNIAYYLSKKTLELTKDESKTEKEKKNIKDMFSLFEYILYFDNVVDCESAKETISKLNKARIEKFKINETDFEKIFFEDLKQDLLKKKQYINNFDNKDFNITYKKTNLTNVFNTNIEYNLKFPKIYSKYAIDNVFKSKDINENKLFVLYPIVTTKILLDIINCDFKKKYLVDYSISLNEKEKKIKRLYSIIDDDIAKEKIIIKINFKDFIKEKQSFFEYMKQGFNYAIILDDSYEFIVENVELLKFFRYIIVNKNHKYFDKFSNLSNLIIEG